MNVYECGQRMPTAPRGQAQAPPVVRMSKSCIRAVRKKHQINLGCCENKRRPRG